MSESTVKAAATLGSGSFYFELNLATWVEFMEKMLRIMHPVFKSGLAKVEDSDHFAVLLFFALPRVLLRCSLILKI